MIGSMKKFILCTILGQHDETTLKLERHYYAEGIPVAYYPNGIPVAVLCGRCR